MVQIQSRSASCAAESGPGFSEARLVSRVVRMGLVQHPCTIDDAMRGLAREGLCLKAASSWLFEPSAGSQLRQHWLEQAYQSLQESPCPTTEWAAIREVLDDDALLARVLGTSLPSLRRYAKGVRQWPDAIAARLHWLALVIDQLEGTYNPYGIRRWFHRRRTALSGQSPLDRLSGSWDPDDPDVCSIFQLACSASQGMVAS